MNCCASVRLLNQFASMQCNPKEFFCAALYPYLQPILLCNHEQLPATIHQPVIERTVTG